MCLHQSAATIAISCSLLPLISCSLLPLLSIFVDLKSSVLPFVFNRSCDLARLQCTRGNTPRLRTEGATIAPVLRWR